MPKFNFKRKYMRMVTKKNVQEKLICEDDIADIKTDGRVFKEA